MTPNRWIRRPNRQTRNLASNRIPGRQRTFYNFMFFLYLTLIQQQYFFLPSVWNGMNQTAHLLPSFQAIIYCVYGPDRQAYKQDRWSKIMAGNAGLMAWSRVSRLICCVCSGHFLPALEPPPQGEERPGGLLGSSLNECKANNSTCVGPLPSL